MSLVVSRDNPRYKALKRLAKASTQRKRSNQTLLEGVHLCQAYLAKLGAPKLCVYAQSALDHEEVRALLEKVPADARLELEDALFAGLSQLDSAASVLFVIEPPHRVQSLASLGTDAILIDRIQDPGNLGSILRSASAAGFGEIFLSEHSVAAWSPKVLRAGMGAHFSLSLHEGCDLVSLVVASRIPVYATSSHATTTIYEKDLGAGACAWIFCNEGQGLSQSLRDHCEAVAIPQPGGEESLNVAAAAAICLFEAVRQRTKS